MPSNAATRLALAVLARREHIAASQLEVWQNGGPSNTTLTNIENGRIETLTNATAKKLDIGLRWEPGTALGIWRGNSISDGILIFDTAGALVDIEDQEFATHLSRSIDARQAGDERAMLGTLEALAEVLSKESDLAARTSSIRILFKEPTEESNEALLAQARFTTEERGEPVHVLRGVVSGVSDTPEPLAADDTPGRDEEAEADSDT